MAKRTILVTGGTGFVGSHLCRRLIDLGYQVRLPFRQAGGLPAVQTECVATGDLTRFANWNSLLAGVDAVVHLVARTHVTDEFGNDAMDAYRTTNVRVTRRLAKAALDQGAKHFIYLSSIKAVGNTSVLALDEDAECRPEDSYGITKREAEQSLACLLDGTSCSYTVLRPPLIYGPGVKGNFQRLLTLVKRGVPLPRITNSRSMLYIENLIDVILLTLQSEGAKQQTLHVSDPDPISTTELMIRMARGLGRRPRIVPMPRTFLNHLSRMLGKQQEMQRMVGSLVVSNEKAMDVLGWEPRFNTAVGVEQTSRAFARNPWATDAPGKRQKRAA